MGGAGLRLSYIGSARRMGGADALGLRRGWACLVPPVAGLARRRCVVVWWVVLGAILRDFFGATCGAWAARRGIYDGMTRAEALVLLGFLRGGCGKPLFYWGLRGARAPMPLFYWARRAGKVR